MDSATILALLAAFADQPLLLALAIMAATFASEDAATVAVGILASQSVLPADTAVLALLAGTISGDIGLHLVGRLARNLRWCARIAARPAAMRAAGTLNESAVSMLVVARFVPGTRLPVYVGSGLARVPMLKASLVIAAASLVWTPALFALSMIGGAAIGDVLGWAALGGIALLIVLASRLYRARAAARHSRCTPECTPRTRRFATIPVRQRPVDRLASG